VSAVLVLAIADLGAYAVVVLERVPSASVESTVARWEVPDWSDHYRVEWAPPELTLRGVRMSEGYAGMQPRRRLRAPEGAKDDPVDAAFIQAMRVANVRRAYEVDIPAPLPRARLLTRAVTAEGDLRRQLARLDVERIAVVDRAIDLPSGLPGRARIVEESPGRLRLETRALTRQLLVLAESFHPGWRARVDAAPCDVVRVYGDFMGCVVPAGTHRVAFDFEPRSLRVGIALSLLGLVALGPLCVLAAHQARARGNVTS
jgi:hypothetical protein